MSDGKSLLIDTSKCSACRGCQVACKQWNGLPGSKTRNVGTYQNPPDLSANTWKLVHFKEGQNEKGKPYWHFFPEQCRHCMDPPCMNGVNNEAVVYTDKKTGAVIYTARTKTVDFNEVLGYCPYNIPRQDKNTGEIRKCTLCIDRITNNDVPACVKTCPTGATVFGERSDILALAQKRVTALVKIYPKAKALDPETVRVIYIITDDQGTY